MTDDEKVLVSRAQMTLNVLLGRKEPCPSNQIFAERFVGVMDEHQRGEFDFHLVKCLDCLTAYEALRRALPNLDCDVIARFDMPEITELKEGETIVLKQS